MEMIEIMYMVIGLTVTMTVGALVLAVAGKDILMAFKRFFNKAGCDVYIANTNRNISHYYLKPVDGMFRINKVPYVTNPEKVFNLSDDTKLAVVNSLLNREVKLKDRIAELKGQITSHQTYITTLTDESQVFVVEAQIKNIASTIENLQVKLEVRQENYFKDKRPMFLYIEYDPVPKDLFEYYSAMDAKVMDNMLSRKISDKGDERVKKDFDMLKMFLLGAIAASAIAAFFAFRSQGMLFQICNHLGVACNM